MATTEKHGLKAELDLAGDAYTILQARIVERLDRVPILVAKLTRDDALPKPITVLDAEAKLSFGAVELFDSPRKFNGLVTEAVRRLDTKGRPHLEITVQPKSWKLTKRTNCRTFLEKKVDEIVGQVCDEAGVPYKFQLGESYDARANIVQYRETDFDFIRRLLSEEGIAFAHDHDSGELVFFDDPTGLGEAADATLKYVPEFGFDQQFSAVQKLSRRYEITTDKVHLRSFDPKKPRTAVEGKVEGKDDGGHVLEVYAFPARTDKEATAKRFAQVMLDQAQSRRDVVRGKATSWLLSPGYRFSVEEHPWTPLNTELLLVSVELEYHDVQSAVDGHKSHAELTFEAIPTDKSAYRPERVKRMAFLAGAQIAMTTGASGQEVDVDGDGCVVGKFPWDRYSKEDDTASVRMRTVQLPTGGSMLLPRVGWEVLVQCDEGDPDTPVVVSRLYNGLTMPPYPLPEGANRSSLQTATTPGGGTSNELRTDDSKGSEEMFFNASKDMSVQVKNNTTESVGNNATLQVGGDQSLEVTNSHTLVVDADQSITVGGNQKLAIEAFAVDQATNYTVAIGGNRDMKVGGDHKHTVTSDESIEVGSMKTDLVVGKISEKAGGNMALTVGAADVTLTPAAIALEAGGNHTENIGAVKAIISFGGVATSATAGLTTQIIGAKFDKVDADRVEAAGGMYSNIAAGAQLIKADNITFEAEGMLTLVMGASSIILTPVSVSILGTSIKLDGATAETSALVVDN